MNSRKKRKPRKRLRTKTYIKIIGICICSYNEWINIFIIFIAEFKHILTAEPWLKRNCWAFHGTFKETRRSRWRRLSTIELERILQSFRNFSNFQKSLKLLKASSSQQKKEELCNVRKSLILCYFLAMKYCTKWNKYICETNPKWVITRRSRVGYNKLRRIFVWFRNIMRWNKNIKVLKDIFIN